MNQPAPRPHFLKKVVAKQAQAGVSAATPDDPAHADAKLARQIRRNLEAAGFVQLRRIDIAVDSGHATLSGRVARYYLKQLAQNAALSTEGVTGLDSRICVAE